MSPTPGRPVASRSPPSRGRVLAGVCGFGGVVALVLLLALPFGGSRREPGSTTGSWRAFAAPRPSTVEYVDRESLGGPCDDGRPADRARSPGTPWCTLEHALEAAPPGALVRVRGGSYGQLAVSDFHSARFLQFQRYEREPVSIAGLSIRRSDHLRFEGFRIAGRLDVTDYASDLQFAGNVIAHQRSGMYFYGYQEPGKAVRRVLIERNRIEDIDYTGAQGVAEGYGIEMVGNISDIEIRGNTIRSVAEDYIQLGSGTNVRVVENRFLGPTLSEAHPQAHADLWQIFGSSAHIVFARNIVRNTGTSTGLLFQFATPGRPFRDVTIENNLFDAGSRGYEMQIYNTVGLRLVGNTVVGSRWGTLLRDDSRVAPGSHYLVENNIFDALESNAYSEERDWGVEDFNVITRTGGSAAGLGAHDVLRQPRFVNRARGDLRLAPGSPGIDAGTSEDTPRTDLAGRPRTDDPATPDRGGGSASYQDIGAFEYQPAR